MRLIYFGSGAFGQPTIEALAARGHDIVLVVTQPDRPAGRHRHLTPTAIAECAQAAGWPLLKPERPGDPECVAAVDEARPDALIVIAYGHKMGPAVLGDRFAINLHASLLPKYRGAAPINWAMIKGETETGISVITLAQTMDGGRVLGQRRTAIDPRETAGELHDRLAEMGPELVDAVLEQHQSGELRGEEQDPALVTKAPKLRKADGTVRFDQPGACVRARVHGLTPWPGCAITMDGRRLVIHRVEEVADPGVSISAGEVTDEGLVGCDPGVVRLLEVQPPGGRVMSFAEYRRGHPLAKEARCQPL